MALLKNLYLDLSFLNPFKKKEGRQQDVYDNHHAISHQSMPADDVRVDAASQGNVQIPKKRYRELPPVSKNLLKDLEEKEEKASSAPVDDSSRIRLPTINKAVSPPPSFSKAEVSGKESADSNRTVKYEAGQEARDEAKDSGHVLSNNYDSNQKSLFSDNNHAEKNADISAASARNIGNIDMSFFSSLYTHLSQEESMIHTNIPHSLGNKDLFEEMQMFWNDKKSELKKERFSNAVKEELMRKIKDLQEKELEWQKLQLEKERLEDVLSSKEMVIENTIRQLKDSFKRHQMYMNIPKHHEFVLSDGKRLKNLHDLQEAIRSMDDSVFSHHVNEHKNDFSTWLKDVFGMHEVAQNIYDKKNKEDMSLFLGKWFDSF